MSNMNLVTSLLHLSEDVLQKINASTFLLMLPVVPHTCLPALLFYFHQRKSVL